MKLTWTTQDIKVGLVVTSKSAYPGGERWVISYQPSPDARGGNVYALTSLSDGMVTRFKEAADFVANLNDDDMWPAEWLK